MNIELKLPESFFEAETRDGYYISEKMKKVWAVQLDLLYKTKYICEKYNIRYFVEGGTMLGAVRHKGFIPWDDDIDVVMYRDEYEKFCSVAKVELKNQYFLQTEYTDTGSGKGHAQIRNSNTTAILEGEYNKKLKYNQGIFIDIFPLDSVPSDLKKRKKFLKKLNRKKKIAVSYGNITENYRKEKGKKGILKSIIYKLMKPIGYITKNYNFFYRSFEKYSQKYNNDKNANVIALISLNPNRKRGFYSKKYLDEYEIAKFEMFNVPIPKEYNKISIEMYGDWTIPVKGASMHGKVIFDTEKSYKEYLK